jgi:diaminohydroxyphosphoribosylaminopyrimidine deaminase/5-amino-6-(5-phosphoribosylamino)uracil reductase
MAKNKEGLRDSYFLKQTLQLAQKARGCTNPNPMVGAIIVKNGKIIGQGYHKKYGGPHAETEALKSVKSNPQGTTLYVNLEPCCHYGKTPPCVKAIIEAKIKKVVFITEDPNPKVAGQGKKQLEQAGIEVAINKDLEEKARELNEAFFTFFEKKRPLVVLKFASSLDGKIATASGESKWITNTEARSQARALRTQYQAILVGINTVIADNPHLGARSKKAKDPIRIILDPQLLIPLNSQILRDQNVLIFTTIFCNNKKKENLEQKGFQIVQFPNKIISIKQILTELTKRNIISLLIEGGSQTLGNFVDNKTVDKIYAFYAPIIIGGQTALGAIGGQGVKKLQESFRLTKLSIKKIGDNFLVTGQPTINKN